MLDADLQWAHQGEGLPVWEARKLQEFPIHVWEAPHTQPGGCHSYSPDPWASSSASSLWELMEFPTFIALRSSPDILIWRHGEHVGRFHRALLIFCMGAGLAPVVFADELKERILICILFHSAHSSTVSSGQSHPLCVSPGPLQVLHEVKALFIII